MPVIRDIPLSLKTRGVLCWRGLRERLESGLRGKYYFWNYSLMTKTIGAEMCTRCSPRENCHYKVIK